MALLRGYNENTCLNVMFNFSNNLKQKNSYGGEINLDEQISLKAKKSLDKMLKMSI